MERYVPAPVARGDEAGFFRTGCQLVPRREHRLRSPSRCSIRDAAIYEYLDRPTVHELIEEHLSGRANRRLLIWSLLSVEQWCQTFVLGERTV